MYTCKRCGYVTNKLSNYKTHLNRVIKCQVGDEKEDIDCSILLIEANQLFKNTTGKFVCKKCNACFNHHSSKYRHERSCNAQGQLVYTINNNIQNIQNNIIINNFGFENTSYLDRVMMKDCLKEQSIVRIFEQLYFHQDHPENHNVRLSNYHKKILEYYEDGKWIKDDTKKTFDDCITQCGYYILRKFYLENKVEIDKEIDEEFYSTCKIIEKMKVWFKNLENEDERVFKQHRKEILTTVLEKKMSVYDRS